MAHVSELSCDNWDDQDGNPAGGIVQGVGVEIHWHNGPLAVDGVRREQSGAFVEDVLRGVIQRMEYYQSGKFSCRENALAITKMEEALHWMNHRTSKREDRGVEGTHTV